MIEAELDSPPIQHKRKYSSYVDDEGNVGGGVSQKATSRAYRWTPTTTLAEDRWGLINGPVTACECKFCKKTEKLGRPLNAKDKKRIYKQSVLNKKRVEKQKEGQTGLKAVAEKRVKEALVDTIMSPDFALEASAPVNVTGYVAKPTTPLPQRLFSLSELRQNPEMRHYAWDGK